MMVVSNVQVLFKLSATEALVWAVNLDGFTPVANARLPSTTAWGRRWHPDKPMSRGIFHEEIRFEGPVYHLLCCGGGPGEENFGMALSSWSMALLPGISVCLRKSHPATADGYLYTDRPILPSRADGLLPRRRAGGLQRSLL